MPEDDPTRELQEIMATVLDGELPEEAYTWAREALSQTENLLQEAGVLLLNGQEMTGEQEDALEEIYREAWQWLKATPN